MKYPATQFSLLIEALKLLAPFIDLKSVNPHALHYVVSQQFNPGQVHNWLIVRGAEANRVHKVPEISTALSEAAKDKHPRLLTGSEALSIIETFGWFKMIDVPNIIEFDLYPEGCNDTHIETAMKSALKQLFQK